MRAKKTRAKEVRWDALGAAALVGQAGGRGSARSPHRAHPRARTLHTHTWRLFQQRGGEERQSECLKIERDGQKSERGGQAGGGEESDGHAARRLPPSWHRRAGRRRPLGVTPHPALQEARAD